MNIDPSIFQATVTTRLEEVASHLRNVATDLKNHGTAIATLTERMKALESQVADLRALVIPSDTA